MSNWQKIMSLIGLVLVAISPNLIGCSIWQSEGRKFLEKNWLEMTNNRLNNFISYQQQDCSTNPNNQTFGEKLTGEFHIVGGESQWELRTFSQKQSLGFQQHMVQIQPIGEQILLYCYPITTKVPTRQLSSQQIQQFFSSL